MAREILPTLACRWLLVAGALILFLPQARADPALAPFTLVLFNTASPGSAELAAYYAEKRGIPKTNIIGLEAPLTEQISRHEYNKTIATPLRLELISRGIWKGVGNEVRSSLARYAVLMRGMPLKISSALPPLKEGEKRDPIKGRDEASVDSELSVLGASLPEAGAAGNPFFRSFTPAIRASLPPGMLLVTRLDGPSDEVVKSMIDGALRAERRGLKGWALVDLRGISSGPYALGDKWLEGAVEAMRNQGIPVATERTEATLPAGFPINHTAVYYGWYAAHGNGPFAETTTNFTPGAIAMHIHSFSAATLRNPTRGWAAPLVARGAAVSAGNVYEPYLGMTLHPDLFQDRLMSGFCVADAAYASTPVLSWMGVILGDPLYRPYASWRGKDSDTGVSGDEWDQYRAIVLRRGPEMAVAAPYLSELSKRLHNPMPLEAIGCWQMDRKDYPQALATFRAASRLSTQPWQRFRLDWWCVRTLAIMGRKSEAVDAARKAFGGELTEPQQKLMLAEIDRILPKPKPTSSPLKPR